MKKAFLATCIVFLFAGIFTEQVHASVDLSIGANAWFCWWQPPWEKQKRNFWKPYPQNTEPRYWPGDYTIGLTPFRSDGKFMYGPAVSVRFLDRWVIAGVFYFGQYYFTNYMNNTEVLAFPLPSNGNLSRMSFIRRINKYDADLNCSYQVLKYMKVFLGYKFQGYYYKERYRSYNSDGSINDVRARDRVISMGPGLGVAFNVHIVSDLYLITNLSGVILWGYEAHWFRNINKGTKQWYPPRGYFTAYGGNASLAFAYYIAPANLTVTLGGRYQILYYRQKVGDRSYTAFGGNYDHFYGATMSVTYTFSFGKHKEAEEG